MSVPPNSGDKRVKIVYNHKIIINCEKHTFHIPGTERYKKLLLPNKNPQT